MPQDLGLQAEGLEPASSDASFRRYFRVFVGDAQRTFIVMDAPPGKEDVRPYLKVSRLLEGIGVHVPHVHEMDDERGLLLLEDLGSTQYLARLNAGDDPEALYGDALQRARGYPGARAREAAAELAPYDREPLLRELALMPEWFMHAAPRPHAVAGGAGDHRARVRVPDRRGAGAAAGVRPSRLSLAQSDGRRASAIPA